MHGLGNAVDNPSHYCLHISEACIALIQFLDAVGFPARAVSCVFWAENTVNAMKDSCGVKRHVVCPLAEGDGVVKVHVNIVQALSPILF